MADQPPPWANKTYSTPPPDSSKGAAPGAVGIPGGAQFDTPPPGGPPPGPGGIYMDPSIWGTANQFVGGLETGELDPLAGVGIDLRDPLGKAQSQTTAGQIGRVIGNIANPSWEVLRPIEGIAAGIRYAGPAARLVRAGIRTGAHAVEGAIGGAVMPGTLKERAENAAKGALIGAGVGAPGTAARFAGFPSLTAAAKSVTSRIPGVSHVLDAARSLSIPDFNLAWYRYILHPIRDLIPGGGDVPTEASRDSMAKVEKQVGSAIDNSTAGMMLDARPGTPAAGAISNTIRVARANITDTDQWNRYAHIVQSTVLDPLNRAGGRFGAAAMRSATSNLAAAIREIRPTSESARTLRFELEQLRTRMFDNSFGGNRRGWARARDAWHKFAIARDSAPSQGEGHFTPDQMSATIHQREPLGAPSGRGAHQDPVQAAQHALLLPGRAAANAIAGRPASSAVVGRWARPGAAAAAAPTPETDTAPQPPTYRSLIPGL